MLLPRRAMAWTHWRPSLASALRPFRQWWCFKPSVAEFSRSTAIAHPTLSTRRRQETIREQLTSRTEVSGHLVGSPAFKAGGGSDPVAAGSIPVHLRQREVASSRSDLRSLRVRA